MTRKMITTTSAMNTLTPAFYTPLITTPVPLPPRSITQPLGGTDLTQNTQLPGNARLESQPDQPIHWLDCLSACFSAAKVKEGRCVIDSSLALSRCTAGKTDSFYTHTCIFRGFWGYWIKGRGGEVSIVRRRIIYVALWRNT